MGPSARTAYVYVDGWNFYYGINRPDLHQLGFCNFWKLGQHLLGTRATVTKVRYFSATDYHTQVAAAQQKFWLRALRSVKVGVEDLGRFQRSEKKGYEEKTTDVRLALQLDEDARTAAHKHKWVLLISADADFVPALQRAKRHGKMVKVAVPLGLGSRELKEVDPNPFEIDKQDLELNLIDGEGTTETGERLSKAHEYGWACRLKGRVVPGDPSAERAHWARWPKR
jgi:hypothetical protein